jgi:hypothetical protein
MQSRFGNSGLQIRKIAMANTLETTVAAHYGRSCLTEAILAAAEAAGADVDNLGPADLAPVDEFHTAGRTATLKALAMLPLKTGMHVLDAGCGIRLWAGKSGTNRSV